MGKERNKMNLKACLANGEYKGIIFEHYSSERFEKGRRYEIMDMNYDLDEASTTEIVYIDNER